MAKQKKKGQAGQAKNYITRTQAVRKLQISLPDFRRLCIFKGIYPREPRNIKKANKSATHSTTFYYTKDIQYLLHEPLLAKFRDQKALSKKIAKSLGRNELQDALRLERNATPKIKLDHIVRERYPTFVDALRDLDDALSLLFLFANLPSTETVPPKVIAKCQRLCHEFEHYLITTNSLKKSFLSIKGIYYQATIQGQDIMWLVPYRFVQRVTQDVDYRIMGTFVEFYCTLLGFVNYRLYTSIGLVYPPKFDVTSDERGAELAAFTLEGRNVTEKAIESAEEAKAITNGHSQNGNSVDVQATIDRIAQEEEQDDAVQLQEELKDEVEENGNIDRFEVSAPEADELPQPETSSNEAANLFSNLTFYISREAPRHPIEFLLRAFGCKRVGWDNILGEGAFTHDETDPRITHQIVDRPAAVFGTPNGDQQAVKPGFVVAGQIDQDGFVCSWCYSATSFESLVKPVQGQYDPRATLEEQQRPGEEDEDEDEELDEDEARELVENAEPDVSDDEKIDDDDAADGMKVDMDSDEEDGEEEKAPEDSFGGFGDQEVATDDEEDEHQAELAAEAAGKPLAVQKPAKTAKDRRKQERTTQQKQADEEIERQKMMMSNKKRKLYEKMQHSNSVKDAEAEKLRQKRRKLEKKQK
ncbi:mRNA-binding ribosome synthesis protein nop7 [Neophaeococcomyces mojaviensis]|uniref:mRNA-binding ribosome synthesis protein nop7 n=1 Tax=Neophaeococcomyces mojaviensis TaxID=3383035 RepID=A0ACC2ZXQ7_9EURO|nr:mRNA-binding ribosome synthesis protein nop7 [Knufia sp. JES_112]